MDDTLDPHKARVRMDGQKWAASKILPRVYGDQLDLKHSGTVGLTLEALVTQALQARPPAQIKGPDEPDEGK